MLNPLVADESKCIIQKTKNQVLLGGLIKRIKCVFLRNDRDLRAKGLFRMDLNTKFMYYFPFCFQS